jgi:uncharacterized Ntn-hydrolase superfamily protein
MRVMIWAMAVGRSRGEGPGGELARRARAGTYSILARDATTGELGVAVQSHWFSVGPIVPWAQPGVGAVATQANVEISYGPRALELLEQGASANEALARLTGEDPGAATRQVAIVDAQGRTAAHTGSECMAAAGHVTGEGVCCQANIMASDSVWGAMLDAFAASRSTLRERLLVALDAAEAAGGDIRGRQSAAILVVPAAGEPWEATVSLRVEDHPEPLLELRRLCRLHDAYVLAGDADALAGEGRHDEASALYRRAAEMAPQSEELSFWAGLGAAYLGDVDEGVRLIAEAISIQPGWRELLGRLTPQTAPAVELVRGRV